MYICISGAHSQGKTTLCNALKNNAMLKDYEFISSPIRDLQKQGFPINQDGNEVTQLFVISKYYEYSKKKGPVIADLENIATYKNSPKIVRLSGSVEDRVSIFLHEMKKFIQTNYLVE